MKKLTRPKNATALVVVKTNQMVWDFLSPMIRTGDKKLQNVQASIVKGAISLTKMANVMGQSENPKMSELLSTVMESLALFGHANRQLCMFRREAMKPDMKGEYSHLCSHNLKFTDYLFGDDVPTIQYNTNTLFPKIGALSSIHKSTYIYKHQMNYILCL